MPLQFRHFKNIVSTTTSYIVGHSSLTDLNPGSVVRTLCEAFSLELSEVYVQVQNLLNLFSIDKATGDDLDERALDFLASRQSPTKSFGAVAIGDQNLTPANAAQTTLSVAASSGANSLTVSGTGGFPATGTLIIDRGFGTRERVGYTLFGGTTFALVQQLANAHPVGATVQLSTVGADRQISAGTVLLTLGATPLRFVTTAAATLLDGDIGVVGVPVQSVNTGSAYNVVAGSLVVFESPPFPTAAVNNYQPLQGGQDLETDEAFRARIKDSQQSLSSATAARIESEALKVQIASTGQQVVSAKLVEPVAPGLSILYISDGTPTFTAMQQNVTVTEVVVATAKLGQTRAALDFWPLIAGTENLYLSRERGVASATAPGTLTDASKFWTSNLWAGYLLRDVGGAFYTVTANNVTVITVAGSATPALGPYALINPAATVWPAGSKLVAGTHYVINNTNGQLMLTTAFPTGMFANDCLLAYAPNASTPGYIYASGLVQQVQRVINGDPNDLVDYPGVKAAGTQVQVAVPTLVDVPVHGVIVAETGIDETSLRLPVQQAIVGYINSLGIGDDVLISRIIEVAVSVDGVFDFQLQGPLFNVVISVDQLAKIALTDVVVN